MKDVFDIIAERNFDQLTTEEHSLVTEVCANEDEFIQMKQVLMQVEEMNAVQQEAPSPKVKASLDDIFAAQIFPKTAPIWYNKLWVAVYPQDKKIYQRPLIHVAAVLLLIIGILPMMMNTRIETMEQIAKLEEPVSNTSTENEELLNEENIQNKEKAESILTENETVIENHETKKAEEVSKLEPATVLLDQAISTPRAFKGDNFSAPVISRLEESSNHPDGVFNGGMSFTVKNSITVSEQPEILDLLTATF